MGKKKQTMWVGGAKLVLPEPDSSTTTTEVVELIPATLAGDPIGALTKYTIEAIYLHFSTRRVGIVSAEALGFLVWVANAAEGGNVPVQALDALSTESRFYGNKNIVMMQPLEVPPFLASGDLATAIPNGGVMTEHHEFQASRKFDRSNQVLAMTINCETAVVVETFAQWRILLEF